MLLLLLLAAARATQPDASRRGEEPALVSFRVLEGVTEPFARAAADTPLWREMKASADARAARKQVQQALAEYGQLLRHPLVFADLPLLERYDVFLSMAKLLRLMGFHQKAELVLYEALGYSPRPLAAHFQLAALFLEQERLDKAKMHLKQCLYFEPADLPALVHLAVVLIAEGRVHEAKFYVSRVLDSLLARAQRLDGETRARLDELAVRRKSPNGTRIDYRALTAWLEGLLGRGFHGELRAVGTGRGSELVELFARYSDLLRWLAAGEMNGRFVFDLGAALIESGVYEVGALMLRRGRDTADESEGAVSIQVIQLRIALDFPAAPRSLAEAAESFLRMTAFLTSPRSAAAEQLELEDVMDLSWAAPLVFYSGLPAGPSIRLLMRRFKPGPVREDLNKGDAASLPSRRARGRVAISVEEGVPVRVLVVAGHLNAHPVGFTILHRVLDLSRERFEVIVAALPLETDSITRAIASRADRLVRLPLDMSLAWEELSGLDADVVLFPDWQPFPDQQALILSSSRLAPVQACFFVRGSSCATADVDFYLLPRELEAYYLSSEHGSPTLREFTEQVVLVDWPVYSPKIVREIGDILC